MLWTRLKSVASLNGFLSSLIASRFLGEARVLIVVFHLFRSFSFWGERARRWRVFRTHQASWKSDTRGRIHDCLTARIHNRWFSSVLMVTSATGMFLETIRCPGQSPKCSHGVYSRMRKAGSIETWWTRVSKFSTPTTPYYCFFVLGSSSPAHKDIGGVKSLKKKRIPYGLCTSKAFWFSFHFFSFSRVFCEPRERRARLLFSSRCFECSVNWIEGFLLLEKIEKRTSELFFCLSYRHEIEISTIHGCWKTCEMLKRFKDSLGTNQQTNFSVCSSLS